MYIDNGPNQGFPNTVIAISKDGIVWDTIRKSRIDSVTQRYAIGWNNPPYNFYQFPNLSRITFKMGSGDLDFDIQEIQNQPAWVGGTQTAHNQAVADINSWL
jgi:hypothetical protein